MSKTVSLLSPAAPKDRDEKYWNAPNRPSVCLSVTFSFSTVIFSKLSRYVHHVMGVCCIVLYIDWMLFDFFLNFWKLEKCPFTVCMFHFLFLHYMLYFLETFQVPVPCYRGVLYSCWYWLDAALIVSWMFEILKSAPSLIMWLSGRWFLQIVDREF